jgi:hypothetical protein
MARFNLFGRNRKEEKTINKAGGEAFAQTPELELVSLLLTSFAGEQFYRSGTATFDRLKELIAACDKEFAAKAAVYARTRFGMRSISHVAASELAKHITAHSWAKDFYNAVIHRPDDMTEILAYHMANNGKVPNAMKKGMAAAFDKFDAYQLAKYRGENKAVKLVDVVNIVHPKPTEKNAEALKDLVNGRLRATDTWEAALTKAGQDAGDVAEKAALKKEAWASLIRERRLGYFALLRNLRNIITQSPEALPEALAMLTDEKLIRKSLVLPFRFITAHNELQKMDNTAQVRLAMVAVSKALDISLANVPNFAGDTLVVLDVSGSMAGRPAEIGSVFSAVLAKACNADFMTFSDSASYRSYNPADSTLSIAQSVRFSAGGTNFPAIFWAARRRYDRIIILSDMQGWIGHHTPAKDFAAYCQYTGADPFIYSFDLNGYGSLQFPERNVFCLAGFSDKVFDIMQLLETDRQAMIHEIAKISF